MALKEFGRRVPAARPGSTPARTGASPLCKPTADADGSPIVIRVHGADIQDRDGAVDVIVELLRKPPEVSRLFADGGYAGPMLGAALEELGESSLIGIVEKPREFKGFAVLFRRWVVERTFAWMGRCRRLAKDFERTVASSLAWAQLAACRFLMRRVARERSPRLKRV